jgi:CheY-like chemotaxis protein
MSQVPLQSLIDELIEMFRLQAKAKGIHFEYIARTALPSLVIADEKHLRQILINLLSNAVKFTTAGQVSLAVRYRNEVAEFTISDTGVGIDPSNTERIFEPFERIQTAKIPQPKGTGLGLTISKLLTEIMGGDISCTSEPGVGSTFKLALMLSAVAKPTMGLEPVTAIESYIGNTKTVMVADDDADHRNLIAEILRPLGFLVVESSDGISCSNFLNINEIDLFLLDVNMPGMNGWALATQLRKKAVTATIIIVSADAYENPIETTAVDSQPSPNNDYITKPIRINILLGKIANALDLTWCYDAAGKAPKSPQSPNALALVNSSGEFDGVTHDNLRELIAMAEIGFLEGIESALKTMADSAEAGPFIGLIRSQLSSYQFSKIVTICKRGLSQ